MPTVPTPPLTLLLSALVDDAALCPPANAPMPSALSEHTVHRTAAYRCLVGAFLCPDSRLPELSATLTGDTPLPLGVILDTGLAGLAPALAAIDRDPRLTLAAVQVAPPREGDPRAVTECGIALGGIPSYVEVPLAAGWEGALDQLAETGCGAALRTRGPGADEGAVLEVAEFVRGCVDRQLAFTWAAGAHAAVRGGGAGAERHGFLNLLAATAAALDGAEPDELAELLDSRDGTALVARLGATGEPEAEVTRSFFRSFGSCSMAEPVAELRTLGVLA